MTLTTFHEALQASWNSFQREWICLCESMREGTETAGIRRVDEGMPKRMNKEVFFFSLVFDFHRIKKKEKPESFEEEDCSKRTFTWILCPLTFSEMSPDKTIQRNTKSCNIHKMLRITEIEKKIKTERRCADHTQTEKTADSLYKYLLNLIFTPLLVLLIFFYPIFFLFCFLHADYSLN